MNQKSNIAILILAAGESSRMTDHIKQLLPWKGITLLQNAIQQANATIAVETFVVLGANKNEIQNRIDLENYSIIQNDDWKSGIGSSISAAIKQFSKQDRTFDAILIMLADQPLIDTTYLNNMIALWKKNSPKIIATKYKKRNGVPAIFSAVHHFALKSLNEDFGAKEIMQQHKNVILGVHPNGKEIDIDTWQEYQKLIKTSQNSKVKTS